MTHHPSRKQFFASLLGAAAAASVLPGRFAKSPSTVAAVPPAGADVLPAGRFEFRHDARVVARRDTF